MPDCFQNVVDSSRCQRQSFCENQPMTVWEMLTDLTFPIVQWWGSDTESISVTGSTPKVNLTVPGRTAPPTQFLYLMGFLCGGPSVWNSLPDSLQNLIIGRNGFRQSVKTFLFATYWCIQRTRGFTVMHYINRLSITYLLKQLFQFLGPS